MSNLSTLLSSVPDTLRNPLVSDFEELLSEYRAGDWEKVGLKAGKICETVYCILEGHLSGTWPPAPTKPKNMVSACQALEHSSKSFGRPARIQIPRMLIALYELRNNRSIGHVSGDLSPNHMDGELFQRGIKWIMAELVRLFAGLDVKDASAAIEQITVRDIPVVWSSGDRLKILNPKLTHPQKALILAYSVSEPATARLLCEWSQYSNLSRYRAKILRDLDTAGLLDFDMNTDIVRISTTGIAKVEKSDWLKLHA